MLKKYYSFPAILYYEKDSIAIEFPDLPGCLPCASSAEEALHNAKEALGLHLFGMEQDGEAIPQPTPIKDIHPEENGVITLIDVFMPTIRDRINNKVVKKTLTIPAWLNRAAEAENVNFSLILQEGLKNYLGNTTRS